MAWDCCHGFYPDSAGLFHLIYSVDLPRLVFPFLASLWGGPGFSPSGRAKNADRCLSGTLRFGA